MSWSRHHVALLILSLYLVTGENDKCLSHQFECGDGECIDLENICDGYPRCNDGADELNCGAYQCYFAAMDLTVESLMSIDPWLVNITKTDAEDIVTIANAISNLGIDITDNLIKISLLFVNYISALFIIIGLYLYEKRQRFQEINVNYIVILIILTQHIIHSSLNFFYSEPIYCTSDQNGETISWFLIMQNILLCILWIIWVKCSYSGCGCCNKYVCGSIVFVILCIIPILVAISTLGSNDMVYFWMFFRVFMTLSTYLMAHILIVIVWIFIVNKFTKQCTKCQKISACTSAALIAFIITFITFYFIVESSDDLNFCFLTSGGYIWMNPIYVILSFYLLFTYARWSIVCSNLIMLIIVLSGIKHSALCYFAVNVSYIANALLMQVYIVIIFFSIKELKQWKMDIIQMYTVSVDVLTDIIVIYYFVESGNYIFAILQTSFILVGQIIGTLSDIILVVDSDQDEFTHLTKGDKILTIFGFSGAWFTIKSWSNQRYETLQLKHAIWEIMFEDIPSVALQMYAALTITEDSSSTTLTFSIIFSAISMSYDLWKYFVDLSKSEYEKIALQEEKEEDGESNIDEHDQNKPESDMDDDKEEMNKNEDEQKAEEEDIEESGFHIKMPSVIANRFGTVLENKKFYLNLYGFIMSDMYVRTVPLVIFIASIQCQGDSTYCIAARIICGISLISSLLFFEFVMNKRMRMTKYQNYRFILSIFSISVLSSFHTILSSLDLLKTDKLYAKCVDFKGFLFEHKIRIYISLILNLITICLFAINEFDENMVKLVLIIGYFIALIINYLSINMIQTDIDSM